MNSELRPGILVVEDENVVAMDLVSNLEKLHYPVVGVAATGEDAVRLAGSNSPGLILMDINLRGDMDGIRAAQQIHERFFIPVVYLTAYSDDATLARASVTHPFGYILKPFDEREIEVAIQTALYRHRLERALRDSEKRLEAILASIGEAVVATDTDRRVTFLNHTAEQLLGWGSNRARGRLLSDVIKTAARDDGSLRLLRAGVEPIPIELVESPVLDSGGSPTGYVTVARDVSERLRAQEAHDRELIERAARVAAEHEQERARLKGEISLALSDITGSVDQQTALRRVADLIAHSLGTWCIIHIEDRAAPVRLTAHADPRRVDWAEECVRRWLPNPDGRRGTYRVMRTGDAELVDEVTEEVLAEIARDPEHLATLRNSGMTSYICAPLRARQRTIGALSVMATDGLRRYGEADLAFIQQIADRVALALDNARLFREAQEAKVTAERLYEAEQRARAEAEALFRLAEALSEAQPDLTAVVQRVTDSATELVGARFGAFFYNVKDERGESYMLYTLSGAPREAFDKFGLPRNSPVFAPTFAGEATVRIDNVREDPRYGTLPPHYGMPKGHLPVTSYLAVPVVSRAGVVIGGLFFGHPEPARFTEQHERMAKALAAHAAVAIDNARLFQEIREAEGRQARLVRDLERAVRFSEMFVGILGHDLRNPLSSITTGARLVLTRSDSERVTRPVTRILSSADRMSRMIDQILDFTRVRLGRGIPLRRQTTDLADVCRLVLDELKTEAEDTRNVRLEIRGQTAGSWDEDRLIQLVSNLAGNALQHRQPGTPILLVIDGSGADRTTLEVRNQGVIPPDILPVIFEPLRGSEHGKREGASGLGLGLYISQQIAIAHNGVIRVESGDRGETRFTLELPRTPPAGDEQVFGARQAEEVSE